ncbi:MAG TPA: SCO family protein [Candidatus Cybelea sp.]|jgi:protein SCO1/2|nr:SCO family protein [Candidatus Cybelea sp.]
MIALPALLLALVPVHGVMLDVPTAATAIARTDPVTKTMAARIARYALVPPVPLRVGTTFDALLDPSTTPPTLRGATPAGAFAPGLPDSGRVVPLEIGNTLPRATLVDQGGNEVALDHAFRGRTLLLSFVFTRCPDRTLCPAISGKYAYLQGRLDPARFALAEITLDPPYDSPAVLRQYGATYGARKPNWTLLTGTGSTITRLLDEFRISSMRLSSDNFLHDDKLFIVGPNGRIATVVDTASWDPNALIAQARAVDGLASNPLERFQLALIAEAIAICGGSQFAGIALLELTLFTFFVLVAVGGMWAVARVLWPRRS